ncbi:hypothetical protein K4039_05715 [Lyngbya sp. CCAP 1446/10]|uniref:hypothetical protein n=1 Tax=Lyngbya sp. CCAP 1446/10 TaxID=439293 RepID=UPI00223837E2|nr:hypothetical protein [Lyngbya sp. CCAP 1446/10]MCW6049588.1 hypothetical protein [Lyngbya sp. CCAP 1446/10]
MLKIDHPQVYIYSYQLSKKSSKTAANSIWTWANSIWQHFSQEKELIFSQANLGYPLTRAKKFSHSNKIDGSFKFCLLEDSEGILARIGSPETDENKGIEITELKDFNVNNLMLADSYKDWLGQTIFITYKLPTDQPLTKKYLRQVADDCLKNLFPEASVRPPFYRDTKLLGSAIFEYSSIKSQLQVFVYRVDDEIEEKLAKIVQRLFELFYYRHKITKAFIDSRKNHYLLKQEYAKIEDTIKSLETKIAEVTQVGVPNDVDNPKNVDIDKSLTYLKRKLKDLLLESLDYQRALEGLENFNNTINIHVYNYQEKLSEICDKWQMSTEDLRTFKFFIDRSCPYFQRQIQGDLGYFKHGTDLIKIAVDLVAGIVDIEQAEIDRSLERTIQIWGTGLGAGGLVVSAVANYIEKPIVFRIPQKGDVLHPAVASLLLSLLVVIVVSGVVARINGAWKINPLRWFRRKFQPLRLPDSQSPPVNDMLRETEEERLGG